MKKLYVIFISFVVLSACSSSKESKSTKTELRNEKEITNQTLVKDAVETRHFIIKLNKLYYTHGGMADLMDRANYIIVDGPRAIISTAYMGRQYDIRAIAAVNMRGRAEEYIVTNNHNKGNYEIQMKVNNGHNVSCDVYLTISKNGYCSATLSSLKIDNIRYSGYLVPIAEKTDTPPQEGRPI